ncbi:FG-GAP repeat domain-containing protein [Paenibacillus sp. Soil522]|uniref:FG-GAP repeat domain-containing protein n=1 Tax=Paenibacillus sp. Soil522 TaxID=1736388 RepID=UPI0006F33C12|nr:VCBS repeat-containing protein [Paenibacillus sp. Soil522]KRE29697.1 spore coat protein [Paenibacillus sp. Soil522]
MNSFFHTHRNQQNPSSRDHYLLDMKQGDVNGDGIPDLVYLFGHKPDGPSGIFADQITLVIHDGYSQQHKVVPLQYNTGYNAGLFLGDFDQNKIADILVSFDSGGSGGYGTFYIYSYAGHVLRKIFDSEIYNQNNSFRVQYEDMYKAAVSSSQLDVLFTIDISNKGYSYFSAYYNEDGKLMKPAQGEVLALAAVNPIVTNENRTSFDLLALQRIIGTTNADTLGYVENLLTWDGSKFISSTLSVAIPGMKPISHV